MLWNAQILKCIGGILLHGLYTVAIRYTFGMCGIKAQAISIARLTYNVI